LPDDFLNEKRILITNVQKLFNGVTVFGLGAKGLNLGSIVLDDSHACINVIKDSFKIRLESESQAYTDILSLFVDELPTQGMGTFADIRNKEQDAFLKVPYWSWQEKTQEIAEILYFIINEDT